MITTTTYNHMLNVVNNQVLLAGLNNHIQMNFENTLVNIFPHFVHNHFFH